MPKQLNQSQTHSRWTDKKLPDFTGKKAFVLSGAFYGNVVSLMAEAGFSRATRVEEADVVVFIGGSDIEPSLYKEEKLSGTYTNPDRDIVEQTIYLKCVRLGVPMFGICRGAQFLHAMNGGKLWQDVDGHAGNDHDIVDLEIGKVVRSTSIHHQMLIPFPGLQIIATTTRQIAKTFLAAGESLYIKGEEGRETEVEAGAFPETGCFFVQGHPEVGCAEYRSWCMTKLEEFIRDWETATGNGGPTAEELGLGLEEQLEVELKKEVVDQLG